jgi:hypothetical protein
MRSHVLDLLIVQKKRFHHSLALDLYGSSSFKIETITSARRVAADT